MSNLDLMLDVGLANELKMAFRKAGFSSAEIKKLTEGKILSQVLDVMRGVAIVSYNGHVIDLDADPFIPEGWTVIEEHKKGGLWRWNPDEIYLFLSNNQKKGNASGNNLRQKLADRSVMNANVLDYLLAHPALIPDKWKDKYIFFWGTIYSRLSGDLCVRCLYWNGCKWCWDCNYLRDNFPVHFPAAILSSIKHFGPLVS